MPSFIKFSISAADMAMVVGFLWGQDKGANIKMLVSFPPIRLRCASPDGPHPLPAVARRGNYPFINLGNQPSWASRSSGIDTKYVSPIFNAASVVTVPI